MKPLHNQLDTVTALLTQKCPSLHLDDTQLEALLDAGGRAMPIVATALSSLASSMRRYSYSPSEAYARLLEYAQRQASKQSEFKQRQLQGSEDLLSAAMEGTESEALIPPLTPSYAKEE